MRGPYFCQVYNTELIIPQQTRQLEDRLQANSIVTSGIRLNGEISGTTVSSGARSTFIEKDGFDRGFKEPREAEGQR